MELPYLQAGLVHFEMGVLDLDNCTCRDVRNLFKQPDIFEKVTDDIGMFVFDHPLGELMAYHDLDSDELFELHLEFFEDMCFQDCLQYLKISRPYYFFEFDEEMYVFFNLNLVARLTADNQKISCLLFLNRIYIKNNISDFAEVVRLTHENRRNFFQ